jgi:hypothetical protein
MHYFSFPENSEGDRAGALSKFSQVATDLFYATASYCNAGTAPLEISTVHYSRVG